LSLALLPAQIVIISIRELIGAPILIVILLAFVAIGIDVIVRPGRYMNAHLKRGGEMLRDWNEMGVQLAGVLFS
jgi:hypothetical protein